MKRKMKAKILVVDDERSIRITLKHFLDEDGYDVLTAESFDEAIVLMNDGLFDLIISDIILKGNSGIDILREVSNRQLNSAVIMITGAPDINTATEALRLGAYDYIPKPVKKQSLLHVVNSALKHKLLRDEKEKYRLHLETIFKNINEGIVTVDNEGFIVEINDAAKKICKCFDNNIIRKIDGASLDCPAECIKVLRETLDSKQPINVFRHECNHESKLKVLTFNTVALFDGNHILSGAMLMIRDETRLDNLESKISRKRKYHKIIGEGVKIQRINTLIENLADVDTTVLIRGESGTGKELVAEAIHYMGDRKDKALVKVNCSALPENLLESELFGHVKGAFSGAVEHRIGRFEKADGGTISLDEIGDISQRVQVKLLRVLQERAFERVGASTPVVVDVRVVTATNQDLRKKVSLGEFREDLYYRLKVVEIGLPPLREISEDIPLLVDHFVRKFSKKMHKKIEAVSAEVMSIFKEYNWPGNIRELEHTIEYAFIQCKHNIITVDELPAEFKIPVEFERSLHDKDIDEKEKLIKALEKTGWNKSKAARLLGISRPTMYKKIKEIKLSNINTGEKL